MTRDRRRDEARAAAKKPSAATAVTRANNTKTVKISLSEDKDASESTDDEKEQASRTPFRFFDLPAELRIRIYEEVLRVSGTIDLHPYNYQKVSPRLSLFYVNHKMHEEAYRVFYSQELRLFPTHGRFFHTKKPLLMRLPTRYRNAVSVMELRLGPGWSAPPRCQRITEELGLEDCLNLRVLKIFVEIDPSEAVFAGFRGKNATESTYQDFCVDILHGIFQRVPSIIVIEIDAFPAVKRDAPLIVAVRTLIELHQKILLWGTSREWTANTESAMLVLESSMARMAIAESSQIVSVPA